MPTPVACRFTVIIPTLQRSPSLHELVDRCSAHPLVREILVINNAQTPLAFASAKAQVLDQEENIFVNPAWNLGAQHARGEFLAIINDDVLFPETVFDYVAGLLRRGWFGIVGVGADCFQSPPGPIGWRIATYDHIPNGFGVFMCLRRRDYVPVPEQLKIWGGDDWLFLQQRRLNVVLVGTPFVTEMSTTSSAPEFRALREDEGMVARELLRPVYNSRWWHPLARSISALRGMRTRWRNARGLR